MGAIPFLGDGIEGLSGVQEALQDLRLAGLVLSQNGQILALTVHLDFTSEGSASDISDFVDGVLKLAIGLIPDADLADLLRRIEISRNESRLTLRLEVAASEIGELINSILGVSSVETETPEPTSRTLRRVEVGREIPLMPTREHVPEDQTIAYSTTPPTSGDHWRALG